MLIALIHVLFAVIRTILRSSMNILLYSMLSRVFSKWLGFNSLISFVCSIYCLSKIVAYFKRLWVNARFINKKPEQRLTMEELICRSAENFNEKSDEETFTAEQFDRDWNFSIDDDRQNIFPSIVNVPFNNHWLLIGTLLFVDYQMNNWDYTYVQSLIRTMTFLFVIISGSSIRYQTLYERERQFRLDLLNKKREEIQRFIIYANGKSSPIASISVQISDSSELTTFFVQNYQINSKFDDYLPLVGNYMCQHLIDRMTKFTNEKQKSARLMWAIPTCRNSWIAVLNANRFFLRMKYEDFSFLPLVKSEVFQMEYFLQFVKPSVTISDEQEMKQD